MKTEAEKRAGAQRRALKYYHGKRKFFFKTEEGRRRRRSENLKKLYGITLEQWEALFADQDNKCATCGATENRGHKNWHTDHCHRTGQIRGILCGACNHVLGRVNDDPAILRALAVYLEGPPCAHV